MIRSPCPTDRTQYTGLMYRSDRDALAEQVDELRREREKLLAENDAMRTDLLARRQGGVPVRPSGNVYKHGVSHLTPGERAALTRHQVDAFPTGALLLLHFLTFGVFPLVYLSTLHGKLPQAESDDPTAGKAIGFSFIPYFQLYWWFFNALRLCDRLNFQFRLRGLPEPVPRGLVMATCIVGVIPYVNFLGLFFVWPITLVFYQRAANRLAALPQLGADAPVTMAGGFATPQVRVPVMGAPLPQAEGLEYPAEAETEEAVKARLAAR